MGREKDRQQHEEARREAGMMPREEYLAKVRIEAGEKKREALKLREQGLSVGEIAEAMGLSERHVRRLLDGQN